jgi:hypothetical protein
MPANATYEIQLLNHHDLNFPVAAHDVDDTIVLMADEQQINRRYSRTSSSVK